MNLRFKDIMKINHLFELAEDNDKPIVIGKNGKKVYMMSSKTYEALQSKSKSEPAKTRTNQIREKEIKVQSGMTKNNK